jgi:1-aminocyclopropane-1-carboxylate deaminase/D-cysteine desulfhydrase-like pyridoxal-dependent ACC family enzyme
MPRSSWWKTSTTPTSNCRPRRRLRSNGKKPYLVPIGGSNALGALGYVRAGLELAEQIKDTGLNFAAVVLASGSAGTHSGLALALSEAAGFAGDRRHRLAQREDQRPKVQGLAERTADLLGVSLPEELQGRVVGRIFRPRYGEPNAGTLAAVKLVASQEGCCSTRSIPARPWPGCWTASVASVSMKARSSSCTPVGRRRCLPIRTLTVTL